MPNSPTPNADASHTRVVNDSYVMVAGSLLVVDAAHGLLANDSNPANLPVRVLTLAPRPGAAAELHFHADGSFSVQSLPSTQSVLRFSYDLMRDEFHSAGHGLITIQIVNTAPQARADHYTVHAGQVLRVGAAQGLLANDSDADGNPLRVASDMPTVADVDTRPSAIESNYRLHAGQDGSFSFQARPGFIGTYTAGYRVGDGFGGVAFGTVTIDVQDAPPEARADEFWVHAGQTLTISPAALLANDTDADGDTLHFGGMDLSGLAGLGKASALSDGGVRFAAAPEAIGMATFSYRIDDGLGARATGTVVLHVGNAAPVVVDDSFSVAFGTPLHVGGAGVLANDRDPEGDHLRATGLDTQGLRGQLTLGERGDLVFVPEPDFVGRTSARFTVHDGYGGVTQETVSFDVQPPVALPIDPAAPGPWVELVGIGLVA